jgi:hypothetical protein
MEDLVIDTYDDVELAELLGNTANDDVDGLDDIDENLNGKVFVGLGADCQSGQGIDEGNIPREGLDV